MQKRDRISFGKLASAVRTVGACKGYLACLILLAMGVVGAFARFLPQDKITVRADSAWVQFFSAIFFVLSGFIFAIVAGSTKDRNSDASSGSGIGAGRINKFGHGDWPFSPADRLGVRGGKLQRSSDRVDQSLHRSVVENSGGTKGLNLDNHRPEMSLIKKVEFEAVDFRKLLADKRFSNETRLFLEDRLEGLIIESPLNDDSDDRILEWGQSAVSIIDELALLRAHISDEDLRVVDFVCGCICDKMKEMNLALIDKETWDSSCQRAVSVVRSDTAVETKILKKKACGMTFKGKVIKKQEVEVEMPFAQ